MIHLLPTEHLSPTQLLALKRLESGDQIEVRSTSINSLIEIINLLNKGTEITFCSSTPIKMPAAVVPVPDGRM